jgi:hypothetical protein
MKITKGVFKTSNCNFVNECSTFRQPSLAESIGEVPNVAQLTVRQGAHRPFNADARICAQELDYRGQLRCDADPISVPPDATFQDVTYAKLSSNLPNINRFAFVKLTTSAPPG